jgi:uncharacterized protein YukJ
MNQGDTGSQEVNNGVGQDGALFIRFIGGTAGGAASPANATPGGAAPDTWVAMFFRFQNQSTSTNAQGNPSTGG